MAVKKKKKTVLSHIDSTALSVMSQGGQDIVERAVGKWWRGNYLKDRTAISKHVDEWNEIGQRIHHCQTLLREALEIEQRRKERGRA